MKRTLSWYLLVPILVIMGHSSVAAGNGNPGNAASIFGGSRQALGAFQQTADSPFGFHPASVARRDYANNGYGDAQYIGVQWTREGVYAFWFLVQPDRTKTQYDFSLYDRQWGAVPQGMQILANIVPQGPIDEGYCLPNSYLPVDTDQYVAFVKAVVERYDGDGVDDMPGLTNPIKTWQVGNEPNSVKSGFAELQRITYTAIKEACPDCTVLIGGVPGMPPVADYISNFDLRYKPILDALGGRYVDVMDYHWYGNATGDYKGAREAYDHIRAVLVADGFPPIPIWIAEMGAYSGDPVPAPISNPPIDYAEQTERQQALDYFKRFVYPLSFGVRKIFPAFGLMEGFKYDGGYFDFTGLIYDGWGPGDLGLGVKKLSYFTYKKMTEVLEGSDWNSVQTVRDTDNLSIFKFIRNGTPIFVAWWDYFNESSYAPGSVKQVSLTGLSGSTAAVTEVVPMFSSGSEVMDYSTAFRTETLNVMDGTITLSLGDSPVIVEASPCALACAATVPATGTVGLPVAFAGAVTSTDCTGEPSFDWDFGDGSAHSSEQKPTHSYGSPSSYAWRLAVYAGEGTWSSSGTITLVNGPIPEALKKASPPFAIVVMGSNFQNGMKVLINGTEWASVAWKNEGKIKLAGGASLKAAVPKGVPTQFEFVNPDGGTARVTWQW